MMREHHVCREKRTPEMSCGSVCSWLFAVVLLEVSALFLVIMFWDLVGLLEMYVLNPSCLPKATVS